jgi:hypothetical protein
MAKSKSRPSPGTPSPVRDRNGDQTDKDVGAKLVRDEADVRTLEIGHGSCHEPAMQPAEGEESCWEKKWKAQREHLDFMQTHWAENEQKGNRAAKLASDLAQRKQECELLQLQLLDSQKAHQNTMSQLRVSEIARQRLESQLKDARNEPSLADWYVSLNHNTNLTRLASVDLSLIPNGIGQPTSTM